MRKGLYANIHAKRKRGEKMRKKGAKGAPTSAQFRRAAQTVRKKQGGKANMNKLWAQWNKLNKNVKIATIVVAIIAIGWMVK